MKRVLILAFVILLSMPILTEAKTVRASMPYVKFNGTKYNLFFSAKSPEVKSYINEYYKASEGYTTWTELIGVHHYPNAYSPIDHAKAFRDYLAGENIPSSIEVNEENNSALVDFVIIDTRKLPVVIEFNIFRFEKSPLCGTVGLQYAKRYQMLSSLEIDKIKKTFLKSRDKYIKQIQKIEIPDLITVDVDKGKYINHEGIENSLGTELQLN